MQPNDITAIPEDIRMTMAFMRNGFAPALHAILAGWGREKWQKWQGSACRQTAILSAAYLNSLDNGYKWTAWESTFDEHVFGADRTYDHAWAYGINKETGQGIILDLSRPKREVIIIPVRANAFPEDLNGFRTMRERFPDCRNQLNIPEAMASTEFYTGWYGWELMGYVRRALKI